MKAGSRLERVLRSGRFAVTAELNPPDSADPQAVYDRALVLSTVCDAINATDASGAHVHMSSTAVCALLTRAGYEPVMQVSCRDRNRIAMQGDLLGASALGVRNVLCLTGDGVQVGDQPDAKPVFDLDSISLLRTARILRDRGEFLSGRKLESPPELFLGAARQPLRSTLRLSTLSPRQKGRGRGRLHSNSVLLRPTASGDLHGRGPRSGSAGTSLHPGRRRSSPFSQDSRVHEKQNSRRGDSG